MTDIAERLRAADRRHPGISHLCHPLELLDEAADRLEALEAQNRRLRAALEPFSTLDRDIGDEWFPLCEAARTALKEGGEG